VILEDARLGIDARLGMARLGITEPDVRAAALQRELDDAHLVIGKLYISLLRMEQALAASPPSCAAA